MGLHRKDSRICGFNFEVVFRNFNFKMVLWYFDFEMIFWNENFIIINLCLCCVLLQIGLNVRKT